MKKNYLFMFLLGLILLFGCSKDSIEEDPYSNWITVVDNDNGTNNGTNDPFDELLYNQALWAGQNILAGNGTVVLQASDNTIDVTYNTDGDWEIVETHLYIGTIEDLPMNNPGNPIIGQFPYSEEHPSGTTSYTYEGPELSTVVDADGCFIVAAHAVVRNIVTGEEETAWLDGEDYPGQSWATYAVVCQ